MITRVTKQLDEKEKGFTLIELLVVVIIIGILAAIAIPVFLNQRQSAWKASVASDLKNAAVVVETYGTSHNGSYTSFTAGAAGTATEVKNSAGNVLVVTVRSGGNSYYIKGTNTNVGSGTGDVQYYDSKNGGLLSWGTAVTP